MFNYRTTAEEQQLKRFADWLTRIVSEADKADPELARLKQQEREASERIKSDLSGAEYKQVIAEHEAAIQALFIYVESKRRSA